MIKEYKATEGIKLTAKNAAINYIKNFDIIREQKNNGIALLGQPGAGKTHLALGIGRALLERKNHIQVMYMPYLEVMRELKASVLDEEHYNKVQSRYINCELLIIDDLFKDKVKKGQLVGELREPDMKHIYPIVNHRYINHKSTIYSSECSANMLLDLDEALGGRIIESCRDNIIIFKYCRENNYRMQGI
ncbi:MAG: ATP-binding protein [Clostridiaceae bacterium]